MEAPCHAVIIQKETVRILENKRENGKVCEKREMYMKNNGTYFNLDKWILCTTVYNYFVPLIKGNVRQLFWNQI
jgi:hypothetical protein